LRLESGTESETGTWNLELEIQDKVVILLPIVDRELRVAARRKTTFWTRVVAAVLAISIFAGMQAMGALPRSFFANSGPALFGTMKWLSFLFACLAGVFLTSDCLSEEKREGTLGLLFLTDLRGYDVVLGKFISNSLQASYGLLAAFPVIALCLMMGGVSGAEFWRMVLIVCNTLFFSLNAGLLISSISREAVKAMNGTLLVCVTFVLGLPLADLVNADWEMANFSPLLSAASPGYLFVTAGPVVAKDFWLFLAIQHGAGWAFLVLSSVCAPRTWQDKTSSAGAQRQTFWRHWRYGGGQCRAALRHKLLAKNPLLWLALRDRWLRRLVWIVTFGALGLLGWSILRRGDFKTPLVVGYYLQPLLTLALKLWLALQASRFFVDAIRNGAMELVLVAPVSAGQIVHSQWTALWRTFLIPALVAVGLKIAGGVAMILEMQRSMAGVSSAPGFNFLQYQAVSLASSLINFIADLVALSWFGMWLGLTNRKTSVAVVKNVSFVLALPWLALMFVQGLVMGLLAFATGFGGGFGGLIWWLGPLVTTILNLAKDIFFIRWSIRKLTRNFPEIVTRDGSPARRRLPPPLPSVQPPSVIAGSPLA
jgi:ABC-type transport system involved in multi-copper enzyme maturation permease subunit